MRVCLCVFVNGFVSDTQNVYNIVLILSVSFCIFPLVDFFSFFFSYYFIVKRLLFEKCTLEIVPASGRDTHAHSRRPRFFPRAPVFFPKSETSHFEHSFPVFRIFLLPLLASRSVRFSSSFFPSFFSIAPDCAHISGSFLFWFPFPRFPLTSSLSPFYKCMNIYYI